MSFLGLRDLIRAKLKHEEGFEPWRDISMGKVVAVEGSINAGPSYLWVNLWGDDGSPVTAFNENMTLLAGDWVKIGRSPKDPFRWSILGYWAGDIEPEYLTRISRHEVGLHGANHQMPTESTIGVDPVRIYQPALMPLKTTGNGTDLTITIQALEYNKGGYTKSFLGATYDLTSSVPSLANHIRAVLIYLDTNTNVINILNGSSVLDSGMVVPRPALPSDGRISAYVYLSTGQTSISTADDIDDARDFLAGETNEVPDPDSEGQVLMASEFLTWVAGTPMISEDDAWMVGDDDLLVIV